MSGSDSPSQGMSFVFARRFRDLPDALLAKTVLDSASIECILSDEHTIRMNWLWSNLLGGVKLWVREEDIGELLDFMKLPIPDLFEVPRIGEYEQPACSQCNSLDLSSPGSTMRISYAFFILGLPVPLKCRNWRCRACRHSWQTLVE